MGKSWQWQNTKTCFCKPLKNNKKRKVCHLSCVSSKVLLLVIWVQSFERGTRRWAKILWLLTTNWRFINLMLGFLSGNNGTLKAVLINMWLELPLLVNLRNILVKTWSYMQYNFHTYSLISHKHVTDKKYIERYSCIDIEHGVSLGLK